MKRQTLNGEWQFRQSGTTEWWPATVPGGVHTDLIALGKIPDPFVGDNELKVMWVAENDWEYQYNFTVDTQILAEPNIALVCDGLDTIADVYLNGTYLGHAENMFRRWEWNVKRLLRNGSNELRVVFGSPVRFITSRQAQLPLQGGGDIPGGPHLRKAPCHWGWDWGPRLPSIGVWKSIRLEGYSLRFEDVHVRQSLNVDAAAIIANIQAELTDRAEVRASMVVTSPSGERFESEEDLLPFIAEGDLYYADLSVEIPEPQLWWPHGYGEQPLYDVEVMLKGSGNIHDQRIYHVGLRTIELCQDLPSMSMVCVSLPKAQIGSQLIRSRHVSRSPCWNDCSRAPWMPT
jgi:beta-mannosidase